MKIKTFDNFITEAKLEYSRNSDIEDVEEYVHDPEIFVYANSKMLKFAELMCSILNKHTNLNLYINGEYGKIDGDKVIMLFDRDSDKCVCIKPWKGRTSFASLYYFKNVDIEKKWEYTIYIKSSNRRGIDNDDRLDYWICSGGGCSGSAC